MKGRPPKPTQQKKLEGNPGKRKINKREPKPAGAPEMPYGFKTNYKLAAAMYAEALEALQHTGILTAADAGALRLMSHSYQLAIEAAAAIRIDGATRRDQQGIERKNPNLQIFRENSKLFMQWSDRMGLNPSARGRLAVEDPQLPLFEDLGAALFAMVDGNEGDPS